MFLNKLRGDLLEEASDETGAGAGGGEKPLTAAEITELVGRTVNGALTAKLKKELPATVSEALKAVAWKDVLTPIVTELVPKPPEGSGTQQDPPKPDPRLSALESKYADLETKYKAAEQARVEAETKSRDSSAFAALKNALTAHVRPDMLETVAENLFYAKKRVVYDESGRPLLSVKKAAYQGAAEEDVQLTLEDGAAHWAKTEGKVFAPPPDGGDTRGRGTRGPSRQVSVGRDGLPTYDTPATTDAEKIHRANERAAALARKYPDIT